MFGNRFGTDNSAGLDGNGPSPHIGFAYLELARFANPEQDTAGASKGVEFFITIVKDYLRSKSIAEHRLDSARVNSG